MDKENVIRVIANYVNFLRNMNYPIVSTYLFGSFVKGNFTDNSDIDIAIVLDRIGNSYDELVKFMKYRRQFDIRIEPYLFSSDDFNDSNPLVAEILKNGLKVWGRTKPTV